MALFYLMITIVIVGLAQVKPFGRQILEWMQYNLFLII